MLRYNGGHGNKSCSMGSLTFASKMLIGSITFRTILKIQSFMLRTCSDDILHPKIGNHFNSHLHLFKTSIYDKTIAVDD